MRRYGCFKIAWFHIEDNPKLVREIMGQCIILRAEALYATREIEYIAESDWFDRIEEGFIAPMYEINIVKDGNNIKWMFSKAEE